MFLPFYPSLPSGKHKYKFNRHFVPSFSSQACLKANNNHSKHKCRHKANQATTKTTDSKLKAHAGPAVPPTAPTPPAPRPSPSRAPTYKSDSTRTTRSPCNSLSLQLALSADPQLQQTIFQQTIFQQSPNLQKLLHQTNPLSLLST